MSNQIRMSGDDRRAYIVEKLKQSERSITGTQLAELTNVSRQVIVQDISLLKAHDEPIIATNRGYLYLQDQREANLFRRVIACNHSPEQTEEELQMIVDSGVTVVDVIVEHPFYGELTGSLMLDSRYDVEQFIQAFERGEASLLSILTGGVHLHTLEADSEDKLDAACAQLREAGILLEHN